MQRTKVGVADYGLNVWDGACLDTERRLGELRAIGYDGLERLEGADTEDAMYKAARFRALGMDFATCRGPTPETGIRWTAAFGKRYVWTDSAATDFDVFCRQVNHQVEVCAGWGIRVGLHNHLGSVVESQQQLEAFMDACPDCGLVFDTAHLAAADGDPLEIVSKYRDRMVMVHVKDWFVTNPEIGLGDGWYNRGRFCELGAGNIGMDNAAVVKALIDGGYEGWICVEHDTHLRDPLADLAHSREYLREAGV
jgi:sugar phosphate isomerase/epimerase